MTALMRSPAELGDAEFDLEIPTHRWRWSPGMFEMLGISSSLAPSTELLLACKHPDDRTLTERTLADAVATGESFCFQSRLLRSNGYLRTVESSGRIALASDGSPLAVVGSVAVVRDWQAPIFEEPLAGTTSEGDLAVALLARIEEAHAYVFRHHAPLVARAARRVLHDREQVEDVVQAVFEALWQRPERFDSNRGSLAAYLHLQTRTRSIDIVRSEAARVERVDRFSREARAPVGLEDDVIATLSRGAIQRALDQLPETEREPIELAFFADMSYRTVALHLALPEGTVKSRIRNGLFRLRDLTSLDDEANIS
jgi:RNA polymerase sigma-70 factor (ECF subfamily)